MSNLRIALLQSRVHWHAAADNRDMFAAQMDSLDSCDLILLPETFSSGFTRAVEECAEPMDGATVSWMRQQARSRHAVLAGSVVIAEQGAYYNRFIWMPPDGAAVHYDKKHLFAYAGEHERYSPGNRRVIIEYRGFRICPQVCYDLRFPVWCRNRDDYDLLLFVANWPKARADAWTTLLRARAIENQAYVAAVNRVGTDGNQLEYPGLSAVYNPLGRPLLELADEVAAATAELSLEELQRVRQQFPFLADRDRFQLRS